MVIVYPFTCLYTAPYLLFHSFVSEMANCLVFSAKIVGGGKVF